jgi:hypothetical protein
MSTTASSGSKEMDKTKELQNPNKPLEEDDEFEDFPAEGPLLANPIYLLFASSKLI